MNLDPEQPSIVLLSGPSGAGKSSLAERLLPLAPGPTVHLEADRTFPAFAGATVADVVVAYHRAVRQWWKLGYKVIVDGSLPYGDPELRVRCLDALRPASVAVVGVTADALTLHARATERGHPDPDFGVRQAGDVNDGLDLLVTVDTTDVQPEILAAGIAVRLGWVAARGRLPQ